MLSQSLQKLARRAVAPTRRTFQQGALPAWATVDPWAMSGAAPAKGRNFVDGEWRDAAHTKTIPDPLNGEAGDGAVVEGAEEMLLPFMRMNSKL